MLDLRSFAPRPVIDCRHRFARMPWSIGQRTSLPTGATLHYAGPPVPTALTFDVRNEGDQAVAQSREALIRFIQNAYVPRHVHELGADGVQYHVVVTAWGEYLWLRDLEDRLWHCANAQGNRDHLAVHLPLGGSQDAAPVQWAATTALFDAGIQRFGWADRLVISGHKDWPRSDGKRQKACPGPILYRRLKHWRSGLDEQQLRTFRINVHAAVVREGPGREFPIAKIGGVTPAVLPEGHRFVADEVTPGTPWEGESRWLHRADGLGFVHWSVVEEVG